MVLGAAVWITQQAIEHAEQRSRLDDQSSFFQDFTHHSFTYRLADFHCSAGDRPFPERGRMSTLDERDATFFRVSMINDDGADADKWAIRIFTIHKGASLS
jgi:hypothetical protein